MGVFIVISLIAVLLHITLLEIVFPLGTAVAYGIAGLLCGLVLRTRIEGAVQRTLVVFFSTIGFAGAGPFDLLAMIFAELSPQSLLGSGMIWGLVGFFLALPFLGVSPGIAAPACALVCFGIAAALARGLFFTPFDDLAVFATPVLICTIGAGMFDRMCAVIGLETVPQGFARFRVDLSFRLR